MCPFEIDPDEREAREEMHGRWPGLLLLDEIHLAEMRAIVWAHINNGATQKAVAAEIGLTPRKLHQFLVGVIIHGDEWNRVADWCNGKPRPRIKVETVAVGALAAWAPNSRARAVRAAIAAAVCQAYESHGITVPPDVADALSVV
ncbi:MAG TPA: hypothetical protein VEX86_01410 [Longimicrobium sp.]|nr:hypothetical protein [Longimicrobium sp.]